MCSVIVGDASALAEALVMDGAEARWAAEELEGADCVDAPEHPRIETLSVIGALALGGKIVPDRARDAIDVLHLMEFEFVSSAALASRIWELRTNISAYDAAYVAAAEIPGCPSATADVKLVRATGPRCEFRWPQP
jgi:predicted nucleic acid-binding protein